MWIPFSGKIRNLQWFYNHLNLDYPFPAGMFEAVFRLYDILPSGHGLVKSFHLNLTVNPVEISLLFLCHCVAAKPQHSSFCHDNFLLYCFCLGVLLWKRGISYRKLSLLYHILHKKSFFLNLGIDFLCRYMI